jgi:hypothetical protein
LIIGSGDIAKVIRDREGALFFCSGVSNSQETEYAAFKRERELLLDQEKKLCLFYFGSISMYTVSSPYTRHKAKMELLIKSNWNNYNIIRLGNITWGKNPNTFLNYIKNKKKNGEEFEVRDEYKYVIDKDQLRLLTSNLPLKGQNEINVFGKMAKVKDLI